MRARDAAQTERWRLADWVGGVLAAEWEAVANVVFREEASAAKLP